MSMNLYLRGFKEVKDSTGLCETIVKDVYLIQTPTEITYLCLNSKNPFKEYTKWLESLISCNENIEFYKEHVKDIKQSLKELKLKNYKIEWFTI